MIKKLNDINNKLIIANKSDSKKLKKHVFIKKILAEKNCFLKMDIETSYAILRDLEIPPQYIKSVYSELIDIKNNQ